MIKRLKLLYSIYNFFHPGQLRQNLALYRKYGLRKSYFSPVSSADFKHLPAAKNGALSSVEERVQANDKLASLPEAMRGQVASFEEKGYAILPAFFQPGEVDRINQLVDDLLQQKKVKFLHNHKIMFAIKQSETLRQLVDRPQLQAIIAALVGAPAKLFQSINFFRGSEQPTHSDSIHMTTYPLGGLVGVWIALEDIEAGAGPLHYYPGSHHLPYYLNEDYDNAGNAWLLGPKDYSEYEAMIEQKMRENGMKKEVFLARKGEVLLWHANLFHGGEAHTNANATRKSMVLHYFATDRICYHEITQRPALMG